MGAYSQGGQLLHQAAALLPASTMEAVNSVVIFGDPGTAYRLAAPFLRNSICTSTMANKRPLQMMAKL
jgi:cutinase